MVALRAPSLAKFNEVDTVPVSEKYTKYRETRSQCSLNISIFRVSYKAMTVFKGF